VKALGRLKAHGYNVGELRWKSPRKFRSFTYNQSGFELNKKSGQTVLSLSKLADIPIELHRLLPDDATVKEVTLKKEKTDEWSWRATRTAPSFSSGESALKSE
jgi:putative transposase